MSLKRRSVRVRLRRGSTLRGRIHIPEGQSLTEFLGSKLFFLNLTEVLWEAGGEKPLPHLSVRLSQVTWVEPLDPALSLSSARPPAEEERRVELHVGGFTKLHVQLKVARETRMSDYLDANPSFIPLWAVRVPGEVTVVDRVALNHDAIEAVRELGDEEPGPGP
ncbi:MAG: hypothetical protein PVI57_11305 [Gemmatimonadota bacterium]|jgi:hypothetical protein